MKMEKYSKKGDKFKLLFEEKMKPQIEEKLKNEMKVVLSEKYIKETLGVDYNTDNLYIKLRNLLIETNLGVSIKRKNKEFIFYEIIDDVNRESDIFRLAIKDKLIPYLLEKLMIRNSISFKESFLKEFLYVNKHNTSSILNIIRSTLPSEIKVKFTKNNISKEGNFINNFVFYDVNALKQINIKKIENLKLEKKKEIQRRKDLKDSILIENQKILNNVEKDLENRLKVNNENTYKCPYCENGILKEPETICPICKEKVLEKWET